MHPTARRLHRRVKHGPRIGVIPEYRSRQNLSHGAARERTTDKLIAVAASVLFAGAAFAQVAAAPAAATANPAVKAMPATPAAAPEVKAGAKKEAAKPAKKKTAKKSTKKAVKPA